MLDKNSELNICKKVIKVTVGTFILLRLQIDLQNLALRPFIPVVPHLNEPVVLLEMYSSQKSKTWFGKLCGGDLLMQFFWELQI